MCLSKEEHSISAPHLHSTDNRTALPERCQGPERVLNMQLWHKHQALNNREWKRQQQEITFVTKKQKEHYTNRLSIIEPEHLWGLKKSLKPTTKKWVEASSAWDSFIRQVWSSINKNCREESCISQEMKWMFCPSSSILCNSWKTLRIVMLCTYHTKALRG